MANRQFDQFDLSIQKRVVSLFGVVQMSGSTPILQKWNYPTLGVGGRNYTAAPTTTVPNVGYPNSYAQGAEGIRSVTRTSAGNWTVVLQDNYQRILSLSAHFASSSGGNQCIGVGDALSVTNMFAPGGSIIGLALVSGAITVADPSPGSLVYLRFTLQDATEP